MNPGEIVMHLDGEVGLLLKVDWKKSFPYKVFYPSTGVDWYTGESFRRLGEGVGN